MMRPFIATLLLLAMSAHAMAADKPVHSSTGGIFQILIVLLLVLGLMVGAAWLLKKFNASGISSPGGIKIVGGVAVGNRERIMVVEVADQWIVVGVTSTHINALSTMPRQETLPSDGLPINNRFADRLKQLIEKRNAK
ncbi:MAG: flagellar biosynthetic protein FliO [Oxalobacter sp.]|nr:MAG: flagellar biosynthetic protein FliO [Oxalobacter sp.]